MYLFYADASGNLHPKYSKRDYLYVYTAVSLYGHRWHGFEKTIRRHKTALSRNHGYQLDIADYEIKSNWIRIKKEREKHPFLSFLSPEEITELVDLFYKQLDYHHMRIFSVVVDKREIADYFDREKLHRKTWELLLELVENFMREEHPKHQGIMIVDDESKQSNQALASKHSYLQDVGTHSNLWLKHIVEMPLFTRSELSNGIQLADLVGYNIHRAFRENNIKYEHFKKIKPFLWLDKSGDIKGLKLFPDESELWNLRGKI